MALIEDRTAPADVPTTNQLDDLPDDLLGGPPPAAYLKLGTSPYAVETPPERGDERLYCVKLVCKGKNEKDMADGKVRHERTMHCVKMWPIGEQEPPDPEPVKTQAELDAEAEAEAAKDQPPLFGDDGEPETMGDIADDLLGEELADAAGVEFEGGPAFSDGEA